MPYKEKEIEKLYYTISEVAAMFDVNASLIRFWEKEFAILKPKKNKKGNRLFTKEDIENLKLIYNLVKEKGYTLQGAKDKLKGKKDESTANVEVLSKLKEIRDYLLELKDIMGQPIAAVVTSSPTYSSAKPNMIVKKEEPSPPDVSPNQISLFD